MNKSSKLDSVKKQRNLLEDKLKGLYNALDRSESKKYEKVARFQTILVETDEELNYINKHIDRMEKANGITRQFIKGNVRKKFKESSERVANITRTIIVFRNEKGGNELELFEKEMKDVQIRLDGLTETINENKEQRELNQIVRQPSRIRGNRNVIEVEAKEAVGADAKEIKVDKSEQLFNDAN